MYGNCRFYNHKWTNLQSQYKIFWTCLFQPKLEFIDIFFKILNKLIKKSTCKPEVNPEDLGAKVPFNLYSVFYKIKHEQILNDKIWPPYNMHSFDMTKGSFQNSKPVKYGRPSQVGGGGSDFTWLFPT